MSSDDTGSDDAVTVGSLDQLREQGQAVVRANGRAIAVFHHEDDLYAVDNRCPHMGFPLSEGSVENGVLTCHWHHARFELSCGDTFDPWADDVRSFPVETRDGDVYVHTTPDDSDPVERWTDRLETGLEENLNLVTAKATIGLFDAGEQYTYPLAIGARFGSTYRADGWGSGLTTHAAMGNLVPHLRPDDRRRALYTGLSSVADDCAGEPPRFALDAFDCADTSPERLESWLRECVEVRDSDGAERCLRTIVQHGTREDAANAIFAAATDSLYLDAGHSLDFCNKAFELLDRIGWEHADEVLPALVPRLTAATRSEELSSWRQPIDLAALCFGVHEELDDLVAAGEGNTWTRPETFIDTLLSDDPETIVEAVREAIRQGATAEELAREVAHAAALRVARFGTANEFSDWNTVHHTFTYANAVHQAAGYTTTPALYRGVLAGATSVYLDRFLNTPPAPLPDPDGEGDPEGIADELLGTFDVDGKVNRAGELAAGFLESGGEPADLVRTLGEGMLREDAGFHVLQNLEAAVAQFEAETDPERARVPMVATARYLSAHFPTRREREQTFTIAERLNRGERIHEP